MGWRCLIAVVSKSTLNFLRVLPGMAFEMELPAFLVYMTCKTPSQREKHTFALERRTWRVQKASETDKESAMKMIHSP